MYHRGSGGGSWWQGEAICSVGDLVEAAGTRVLTKRVTKAAGGILKPCSA